MLLVGGVVNAQFDSLDKSCDQGSASDSAICEEAQGQGEENPLTGTEGVIMQVANVLAIAAGVIAVVIIIIAGITMMLSGGDPQKVSTSRNAIIYSTIGVVVVVLARSIVIFIINEVG